MILLVIFFLLHRFVDVKIIFCLLKNKLVELHNQIFPIRESLEKQFCIAFAYNSYSSYREWNKVKNLFPHVELIIVDFTRIMRPTA